MLRTVVCQAVVKMEAVIPVIITKTADTANSGKSDGSGLPLLFQIIQISHGSWVSTAVT